MCCSIQNELFETGAEIHTHVEVIEMECLKFEGGRDALLVVDDALVARMQGKVIMTRLDDEFCLHDKTSWVTSKATCQSKQERLFVTGAEIPNVEEIETWMRCMLQQERRLFCLIDYVLEYGGGLALEGTDIIRELRKKLNDVDRKNVVVYMRSGNDTVSDESKYKESGADGMISKCMPVDELIDILRF